MHLTTYEFIMTLSEGIVDYPNPITSLVYFR